MTGYTFNGAGGSGAGGSGLGGSGLGGSGLGGSGFGNSGNGSSGSGSSGSGSSGGGSDSTGSTTEGYTIPIDQALSIAKQIEAGTEAGSVHIGTTAFLGVGIDPSQEGDGQGIEIESVTPGTAAATAGLTGGDVITSVAGHTVGTSTSIEQVLESYHPGDKVSLTWTNPYGQSSTETVTLGTGPAA